MATIESEIAIAAPGRRVWEIISDLDSEPRFWRGTKSVENRGTDGDTIVRNITLAFQDRVCGQRVRLEPPTSVIAEFTHGIIRGSKLERIRPDGESAARLAVTWEIAMTGLMSMFTPVITRHVKSGTEAALEAIKREAESR